LSFCFFFYHSTAKKSQVRSYIQAKQRIQLSD
jgi:hypothetical protein